MIGFEEDTIAAISTAVSEGGIGIVRISGPDAIKVADRIYLSPGGKKKLSSVPTHTIHYGYIKGNKEKECDKGTESHSGQDGEEGKDPEKQGILNDNDSEKQGILNEKEAEKQGILNDEEAEKQAILNDQDIIDEVLVSVMRAPRTYTGEDTVEINCHGGVLAVRRVLECVLSHGARLAEPGEFSKRAFLNGRIDLSEAEAVMDLIEAKNDYALKNSLSQLRGSVSRKIHSLREAILLQTAHIEAALDDPEHYDYEEYIPGLKKENESWMKEIAEMISSSDSGRLIREGIHTVIVGKPNAGKSSLLNLLLGEDRAIVTQIPGTTRDLLTETLNLSGITLVVTDTAGIRDTEDPVEQIGVKKARDVLEKADLILCMTDSSCPLTDEDREVLSLARGRKMILLFNKTDLPQQTSIEDVRRLAVETMGKGEEEQGDIRIIPFSVSERQGYEQLISAVKELFYKGDIRIQEEVVITNMRHRLLLEKAYESLKMLADSIENQMPEDFYSIDMMSAYGSLGEITGEEVGEDLVNEIFGRFCMGK